jgi:hypothetical protein
MNEKSVSLYLQAVARIISLSHFNMKNFQVAEKINTKFVAVHAVDQYSIRHRQRKACKTCPHIPDQFV